MYAKTTKPFSREEKRVAIELWKAKVPLKAIRKQLNISESTLRRVLARMSDSDYLKKLVESMPRRLAEEIEKDGATTGY